MYKCQSSRSRHFRTIRGNPTLFLLSWFSFLSRLRDRVSSAIFSEVLILLVLYSGRGRDSIDFAIFTQMRRYISQYLNRVLYWYFDRLQVNVNGVAIRCQAPTRSTSNTGYKNRGNDVLIVATLKPIYQAPLTTDFRIVVSQTLKEFALRIPFSPRALCVCVRPDT